MTAEPSSKLLVALVGNPNAGKTTLFNALTGSNQKVGNYAGVTVEKVSGVLKLPNSEVDCVDIPGLYSLTPLSEDEHIATKALLGEGGHSKPDLLVYVLDASNLERNLFLFSQIQPQGIPIVVALTMVDLLHRSGTELDLEQLRGHLHVPVLQVSAYRGVGVGSLRSEIETALAGQLPAPTPIYLDTIESRYQWAEEIAKTVLRVDPTRKMRARSDRADRILTHKVWGILLFAGVMYLMFQAIYSLAPPLMAALDFGFTQLGQRLGAALSGVPWLQSLVVDGLISGIASVAIFLPQILILFFFIAILEGSGYLARVSFLMDRALGWCGLNGKAFIPLLSSFACAIPGIMAARIISDPKGRLATILIAPLMSCSARLPVYVLIIGAIIEPRFGPVVAGLSLFLMHSVGLLIAIPISLILNRRVLKGARLPLTMELPPYQWPKWKDVWWAMYGRARVFVQTAGTIIVLMSVLIWATLYFPRSAAADRQYATEFHQKSVAGELSVTEDHYVQGRRIENSILGQLGKGIEPVLRPAGFDWRISTAILAAFPAREVFVSSLGIVFDLGGDSDETSHDLRKAISNAKWPDQKTLMPPKTAFALMVFFALCCQCGSTLATIHRETNSWKWPTFVFCYMTALAWLLAVAINQIF